ncbi:leucine-rich repeat transmembrane neuronal protein 3 [Colias croceus]|uniref:leucine-rich repeat transmembrane neuronal protein 3 n=1 Tax=Colias crocea TaxID=72248 RepID=UPI001E27C90E|nr:leucine-rich repeat transmembrane neuronal protein 3 [Colias croceus]
MWTSVFILVSLLSESYCVLCPKQCDCDSDNGLNRAICVDQNIISVALGVPKEVQVYSLSRNVISELDNFCFKELGYKSIKVLDLSYNQIFWIGLHAFAGLNQLTELNLSNNRLRYFPSDVFWYTPDLNILDLSANMFESLKNEPFIAHSKLQVLNLNSCRIKSLPDRMFTRLPNLKKLDLSENYMVTVNLDVLRPLRKLKRIELRNDYWQCNADFKATEEWIVSHEIAYEKICKQRIPKMFEKMISVVPIERKPVDVDAVWNITKANETQVPPKEPPLTPFQKFDKNFSALQAFVIGVEIGMAIGIIATYVWLRQICSCRQLFSRPQTRRDRWRRRREGDMRNRLLWNAIVHSDMETPPIYRRQVETGPSAPRLSGIREGNANVDERAETPPPPYNECRVNL